MTVRDTQMVRDQKKFENHWPKTSHPNLKNVFFILNYTKPIVITEFEKLSSSICRRVMAGQRIMLFLKSKELGPNP